MMRRHLNASAVSITLVIGSLLILGSAPAFAAGLLPPSNPSATIKPDPNFTYSGLCSGSGSTFTCPNPCWDGRRVAYRNTAACNAFVAQAIDRARSVEHVTALSLPTNWYSLSVPEQLFVLADLERTARGLPPYLGLNRVLSDAAQRGAQALSDPSVAAGFATSPRWGFASTLATGSTTTLEADYGWMYDDGWGGSETLTWNYDCTSATAAGCWGHRDELLGADGAYNSGVGLGCTTCEMGTGFAVVRGTTSYTDLVERPRGRVPAMYFTWAKDVVPFLHQ
jgi:hypothetical protein